MLPAGILFWILLSFRPVAQSKYEHELSLEIKTPTRVSISRPFINSSVSSQKDTAKPGEVNESPLQPHALGIIFPPSLLPLTLCHQTPNQFTNHIRLPNPLYNISMSPQTTFLSETRKFWNPTIFALPYWSKNEYLIITMVLLKDYGYRQNVLCEANICRPKDQKSSGNIDKLCSDNDLDVLGPNGGLRCVTTPIEVNVPPTPAEKCEGPEQGLAEIPGFHDPRIFYSGRGEPLLMVASQSRYACIGLWTIDLRAVYPSLRDIISSSPEWLGPGPLVSYPTLTELTRNPPETRRSYEKNWLMFSPSTSTSYLQYELTSSQRTFAQSIGGGFTTTNMTDPLEQPCLLDATPEQIERNQFLANATWHQATPALKLILCRRVDASCLSKDPDIVFFAAIHRKHKNVWDLPIRYERYFAVWSAILPFNMLAISQHPILFANETTTGWTEQETWDDVPEARMENRGFWAHVTYTTTIAYAWGSEEGDIREKGTGYLDDEVILSVGVDDQDQVYGRVLVSDLLQCLRVCPGRILDSSDG
ncbi:hypothetical protein B7494_g2033 [Chlorociboria aeruginascens]|nr:hypothetical protein B7494_g2033 [Chlorociboria aeruginascens]